jgi:hypothetical protein
VPGQLSCSVENRQVGGGGSECLLPRGGEVAAAVEVESGERGEAAQPTYSHVRHPAAAIEAEHGEPGEAAQRHNVRHFTTAAEVECRELRQAAHS